MKVLLKFLLVMSVIWGVLWSILAGWSLYGVFISIRLLCQFYLAQKNNQEIRRLARRQMLMAVRATEVNSSLNPWQQSLLFHQPDYRKFKNKLQKLYPHLSNQLIWNRLIWRTFFKMGFIDIDQFPPVMIEIPIYHPASLAEVINTVDSLRHQSYPAISEITLCFNDPTNHDMNQAIQQYVRKIRHDDKRIHFLSVPVASKRTAMFAGFQRHQRVINQAYKNWVAHHSSEPLPDFAEENFLGRAQFDPNLNTISVNIDADTQVESDAIALGVLLLLLDPHTTAITSNVEIRQPNLNFLTKLTFARYKAANLVERAAQSSLHTVRCMSGPLMMFWSHNLLYLSPRGQPMATEWVAEKFLQVKVEPGDDRSWTIRHNELGLGVRFHPDMLVNTDCPMSWSRWKKQQLRWLRSSHRNFFISLPFLFRLPIFIIFDDLYLFFFPILLLLVVGQLGWKIVQVGMTNSWLAAGLVLLPYLQILTVIQVGKALHLVISQRDLRFFWLSCYLGVYLRYLIWLRIVSLATITQSEWTGRTQADFSADQAILKGVSMG